MTLLASAQRRIFGIENEYGVTCTARPTALESRQSRPMPLRRVVSWAQQQRLPANGARLYLDVGSHPEYATPECDSVRELVVR